MGSSASAFAKGEVSKPLDASDLTNVDDAKAEVVRYRSKVKE